MKIKNVRENVDFQVSETDLVHNRFPINTSYKTLTSTILKET